MLLMPRPDHLRLGALSLTHVAVDGYASFVPALWLVLASTFDLSPFETGLLVALSMAVSNFSQPLFGLVADRFDGRWLIIVGPLLAAGCMSMIGLSGWLPLTILLIIVGKAGVGMFHPEAAVLAGRFGSASSRTMAVFMASGILGMGLGASFVSLVVGEDGQLFADSWLTILPGIPVLLIVLLLVRSLPSAAREAPSPGPRPAFAALAGRHGAAWCLIGAQLFRMLALNILLCTIPLYVHEHGGGQLAIGAWMLAYTCGQALGILAGGMTTRPRRERSVYMFSLMASLPAALCLIFVEGIAAMIVLAVCGALIAWANPVAVRLGQQIVPKGQRWMSGMLMGTTWGVAALVAPLVVGWTWSSRATLATAAVALAAALAIAVTIPVQHELERLKAGDAAMT
jgi:FSR family fosmidomycin resistance protein-like MFS transporter